MKQKKEDNRLIWAITTVKPNPNYKGIFGGQLRTITETKKYYLKVDKKGYIVLGEEVK